MENNPENAGLTKEQSELLLEVKDLKKYFPVQTNFFGKPIKFLKAVDGISFNLYKGKTLGIVGESGCGKSTMGRSILRLYDGVEGEINFNGQNVLKLKNREFDKLRPNMQMIFQDPYASLSPRLTVGEIIGESARQHHLVDKAGFHDYVLKVMNMCGLQPHYFERYPHEFSGGQRQRICIARALALNPQLVVCDEPVSALDVSIQAQIINMLIELRETLGLTYIFISHDLSVVKHISDDVGVMYLGNIVEYGSKTAVFDHTLHPYTKALFSAVPVPDPHKKMNRIMLKGDIPSPVNPPKGCKFHTRCEHCMEICSRVAPEYREVEQGHFCACHLYNSAEDEERLLKLAEEQEKAEAERKAKEDAKPWNRAKTAVLSLFKKKEKPAEPAAEPVPEEEQSGVTASDIAVETQVVKEPASAEESVAAPAEPVAESAAQTETAVTDAEEKASTPVEEKPAEEKKPAAKKPATAKKPTATKPAAPKTTTAAKKPAETKPASAKTATAAKKPATTKTTTKKPAAGTKKTAVKTENAEKE